MESITVTVSGSGIHDGTFTVRDPYDIYQVVNAVRMAVPVAVGEGSGTHHENTGACLCTSFRGADDDPEQCKDCQHARHYSRPYCGGLK